MLTDHAEEFFQRPVKVFNEPDDWEGPDKAYRVAITWDDPKGAMVQRLDQLFAQPGSERLQAIVIGAWAGDDSSTSSDSLAQKLIKQKGKLPGLRAIFFGDIIGEENEISWIVQCDVSPLLKAYPQLEVFRVRGGTELAFAQMRHDNLRELIVETGGLSRSTLRQICRCDFPKLQHLELWLGVEEYGRDGGVEDLQPILAGKLHPQLKYLGLRNCDVVDEIVPVVVNAPILRQLEVLDLSNGALTDVGARALLNLPADLPLRTLNLSHHYVTPELIQQLKTKLKYQVIADDGMDPNEEWRSVVVSE